MPKMTTRAMGDVAPDAPKVPPTNEAPANRVPGRKRSEPIERGTSVEHPGDTVTPRRSSSRLRERSSSSPAGGATTPASSTRRTSRPPKNSDERGDEKDDGVDRGSISESVSRATETPKILDNLEKWRKADLVIECRRRGLKAYGTKKELRSRIRENVEDTVKVAQVFEREETMEIEHWPETERSDDGKGLDEAKRRGKLEQEVKETSKSGDVEESGEDEGPGAANVSVPNTEDHYDEKPGRDVGDDKEEGKGNEVFGQRGDEVYAEANKPVLSPHPSLGGGERDASSGLSVGNAFRMTSAEEMLADTAHVTVAGDNNDKRTEDSKADQGVQRRSILTDTNFLSKGQEQAKLDIGSDLLNSNENTEERKNKETNTSHPVLKEPILDGIKQTRNGDKFIATFSTSRAVEVEGVRVIAHVESKAVILKTDTECDQEKNNKGPEDYSAAGKDVDALAIEDVDEARIADKSHFENEELVADTEVKIDSKVGIEQSTEGSCKKRNANEVDQDGTCLTDDHGDQNPENIWPQTDVGIGFSSGIITKNGAEKYSGNNGGDVVASCETGTFGVSTSLHSGENFNEGESTEVERKGEDPQLIQMPARRGDDNNAVPCDSNVRGDEFLKQAEGTRLAMEIGTQAGTFIEKAGSFQNSDKGTNSSAVDEQQKHALDSENEEAELLPVDGSERSAQKDESGIHDHHAHELQMRVSEEKQVINANTDKPISVHATCEERITGRSSSNEKGKREVTASIAEPEGERYSDSVSKLNSEPGQKTNTAPLVPSASHEIDERDADKSVAVFDQKTNELGSGDLKEDHAEIGKERKEVNESTERGFGDTTAPIHSSEKAKNQSVLHLYQHDLDTAEKTYKHRISADVDNSELTNKEPNLVENPKHMTRLKQGGDGDSDPRDNLCESNIESTMVDVGTEEPDVQSGCQDLGLPLEAKKDTIEGKSPRMKSKTSDALVERIHSGNEENEERRFDIANIYGKSNAIPSGQERADPDVEIEFNFRSQEKDSPQYLAAPGDDAYDTFSESPLPSPHPCDQVQIDTTVGNIGLVERHNLRESSYSLSPIDYQAPSPREQDLTGLDVAPSAEAQVLETANSDSPASGTAIPHATTVEDDRTENLTADENRASIFAATERNFTKDALITKDALMTEEDNQEERDMGIDIPDNSDLHEESSSGSSEYEEVDHDTKDMEDDRSSDENIQDGLESSDSDDNSNGVSDIGHTGLEANDGNDDHSGDSRSSQGSYTGNAPTQGEQRSPQDSWESRDIGDSSPRSGGSTGNEEDIVYPQNLVSVDDRPSSNEVYVISSDEGEDAEDGGHDCDDSLNNSGVIADDTGYEGLVAVDETVRGKDHELSEVEIDCDDDVTGKGRKMDLSPCENKDECLEAADAQSNITRADPGLLSDRLLAAVDQKESRNPPLTISQMETCLEAKANDDNQSDGIRLQFTSEFHKPQAADQTRKSDGCDGASAILVGTHVALSNLQRGKCTGETNIDEGKRNAPNNTSVNILEDSNQFPTPQVAVIAPPPSPMIQGSSSTPSMSRESKIVGVDASVTQNDSGIAPSNNAGSKRPRSELAWTEIGNHAELDEKTRDERGSGLKSKSAERARKRQRTDPPFVQVPVMPSAVTTLRALKLESDSGPEQVVDSFGVNRCLDFDEINPPSILEKLSQIEEGQTRKHFKPFRDTLRDAQGQIRGISPSPSSEVAFQMGSVPTTRRLVQPTGRRKLAMQMLHCRPSWNVRALAAQSVRRAQQVAQKVTSWQAEPSPFDFRTENGVGIGNGNGSGKRSNVFSLEFEASESARKRRK